MRERIGYCETCGAIDGQLCVDGYSGQTSDDHPARRKNPGYPQVADAIEVPSPPASGRRETESSRALPAPTGPGASDLQRELAFLRGFQAGLELVIKRVEGAA